MRIKWNGPRVTHRIVGVYEWHADNGWVTEVADAEVPELLTQPGDEFSVADDEPLLTLRGVGPVMAGELALAERGSLDRLARLADKDIPVVAAAGSFSVDELRAWRREARASLKHAKAQGE